MPTCNPIAVPSAAATLQRIGKMSLREREQHSGDRFIELFVQGIGMALAAMLFAWIVYHAFLLAIP